MRERDTAWLGPSTTRRRIRATRAVAALALIVASTSVVSVAAARGSGCATAHTAVTATSRPALQHAVVCLINQQRRRRGLPALREDARLDRSAQGWTNTMVARHDFSHGPNFAARISAAGFHWSSAGENIATGFLTPAAVVDAWMASTGHCHNILGPTYRYVGTGVSQRAIRGYGSGGGTWTQDFGLLRGQAPASGNWAPANGCPY